MIGDHNTRHMALKALNNSKVSFPHLVFDKKVVIDLIFVEAKTYFNTLLSLYRQNEKLPLSDENIIDARNSLINLLERRLDGNLERIFFLLGLRYSPENIQSIYKGIQSKKPDQRSNAIEFLDNLLDVKLKRVVMPIVESTILETISKDIIEELNLDNISQLESFGALLQGKDIRIKLAVLYLMRLIRDEKYVALASKYIDDTEPKISAFALEVVYEFERQKMP